ncbi:MAG: hypothetical protein P1U68_14455 [Verrucomicrobiales bacterium]|nr:hypothetical protein [Verrucomicrobiales bacterium]
MFDTFAPRLALGIGFSFLVLASSAGREWQRVDGTSFDADFFFKDSRETWFKDHEGKLYVLENTEVSSEDREFIERLEGYLTDLKFQPWPRQILPVEGVRLTGGPETYRTLNFQLFSGGSDQALVNETGTILENAYHMIGQLPLPLDPSPPQPLKHFTVRMLDRAQFESSFGNSVKNLYPEKVKGAYMAKPRELWLPLDASPAPDFTATLVHEMAHQSMHDWLPLLPLWFIEGMAEYLATIPYQNQIFRFDQSESGLREVLKSRYGSPPLRIAHPARILSTESWDNSSNDYLSSLFLVFYLAEYDRDGKGTGLQAYLGEIEKARNQTDTWFSEIQAVADDYNSRVQQFRSDLARYKGALESAKSELRDGKRAFVRESGPGKVVIAGSPAIPSRPVAPTRPEGLPEAVTEINQEAGNVIVSAKQAAIMQLLQGRSFEEFAGEMKNSFHSRGFPIEYR